MNPDVNFRIEHVIVGIAAGCSLVAARVELVDVVLRHTCGDHSQTGHDESTSHALDGRKLDTSFAKSRVDEEVEDRDHDDNGDGVEILDQIVRGAVKIHSCRLRSQILCLCQPVIHHITNTNLRWSFVHMQANTRAGTRRLCRPSIRDGLHRPMRRHRSSTRVFVLLELRKASRYPM